MYICLGNGFVMFNKETEYALRGLVYIQLQNAKGRRPGTDEVAREILAPRHYTAKILQRMVRLGFVSSVKGKGGGFFFNGNRPELTLKEIVLATEGGKMLSGCGFGLGTCDTSFPCPLHDRYSGIRDAINRLVSTETVQSLARQYTQLSTGGM